MVTLYRRTTVRYCTGNIVLSDSYTVINHAYCSIPRYRRHLLLTFTRLKHRDLISSLYTSITNRCVRDYLIFGDLETVTVEVGVRGDVRVPVCVRLGVFVPLDERVDVREAVRVALGVRDGVAVPLGVGGM